MDDVDTAKTNQWLESEDLKSETEGCIVVAVQDQSRPTKAYQRNIIKLIDVDPECRLCGINDETIDHMVAGKKRNHYVHRERVTTL